MASIRTRTRRDGTIAYQVGYKKDSKLHWLPTVETEKAAGQLKSLVERVGPDAARATIEAQSSTAPLLRDWHEEHLRLIAAHAEPGTIDKARKDAARSWMPHLGDLPVDAITREAVMEWIGWQRRQETVRSIQRRTKAERAIEAAKTDDEREAIVVPEPVYCSAKTIKNLHSLLSGTLQSAVDAGHCPRNVARGVRLPAGTREEMSILTEDEFFQFLTAVPARYRPLVLTLAGTGMRWGEATALKVGDVDLDRNLLRVVHAWKYGENGARDYGTVKSRRSNRTIGIDKTVRDALVPLVKGRGADEWLFTAQRGGRVHYSVFTRTAWAPALAGANLGKHITPHDLRHSHASWLLAAGVPLTVVQFRLGHEDASVTSRTYGHLIPDAQLAAVQAIGTVFHAGARQLGA